MKYFLRIFLPLCILGLVYFLGPKQKYATPKLLDTDIQVALDSLDEYVRQHDSIVPDIKQGNDAKIIWANDSLKTKTEYALVYLHGFSASREEGAPIHEDFARRYGMNLYLTRLEDHGRRDTNSFIHITPDSYLQSAEDAIDIGKLLGKKVIVMSCSTGGTLSLILAAAGEDIYSLIMYSPNIDIADRKSDLLLQPWGKQIAKLVLDGEYNRIVYDTLAQKYWNSVYHFNGIFTTKALIREYMHDATFQKIHIPVFVGYYFKDEDHQDDVVSVSAMLHMFDALGTPENQKTLVDFPEAGHHVISSHVMSHDVEGVEQATFHWAEKTLGLRPVQ